VEYSEHIRTGFVTPEEAWLALKSTIMKSLEYPMECVSLSEFQWQFILAPIPWYTLPKARINQNFPRDLLYSTAVSATPPL